MVIYVRLSAAGRFWKMPEMQSCRLSEGGLPGQAEHLLWFDSTTRPPQAWCEAWDPTQQPRPHWRSLIEALAGKGPNALSQLQERAQRMRHEDSAAFNPFDDAANSADSGNSETRQAPWNLDLIPLLLSAEEWALLEAGIRQRADLLELILQDVYGPQHLLHNGQLPPELVFANAAFLHPAHAVQPVGQRRLTWYAADLYRAPDGRLRVWRDYGDFPAGLGYALENRIVMSRVLADVYHAASAQRLAPFFQTLQRSIEARAFRRRENPEVVLLSPGPDSLMYFEQALLARYLGYQMVEGQDLTVRDGDVFMKKLEGLEPVEAVFRHIADASSDPFALRRNTGEGVAGLIQAMREQQIDIINPIGSGFVDTPALPVLLPALCRQLMGEELGLDNHPAYWCGRPDDCRQVLAELQPPQTLMPDGALTRGMQLPAPAELAAEIQATPYLFMARAPLIPSIVPVWEGRAATWRYVLLRVFACATAEGFAVLPGGLAITAASAAALTGGPPGQQQSKDVWVASHTPVPAVSMMHHLQMPAEIQRTWDLPSRIADHLLWLGRYLERAEGLVRRLRSVYRRLAGETRLADIPELPYLLNLLRAEDLIPVPAEKAPMIRYLTLTRQLREALEREDRPASVRFVLKGVRNAARNVRDQLSGDSWRAISRLEDFGPASDTDPLEVLNEILFNLSAFSGLAMEGMTRNLGWRFMDLGRRIERGLSAASLIRLGLPLSGPIRAGDLEALLEIADSIMTYRARYRTVFQLAPVLDLLLADDSNPKSLAFQCSQIAEHVEYLPRAGNRRFTSPAERLALEMLTAVRLLDLTELTAPDGTLNALQLSQLRTFLESMDTRLKEFAQQICAHYLSRIPLTPHYSTLPDPAGP